MSKGSCTTASPAAPEYQLFTYLLWLWKDLVSVVSEPTRSKYVTLYITLGQLSKGEVHGLCERL